MTRQFTIQPAGGRVIGLWPEPGLNVFWNNPTPYSGVGWPNPGGDRSWISPESELFIPDRARGWASYQVPASVDPGSFRVEEFSDGAVELVNRGSVVFFGIGASAEFELRQRIEPLDDPGFPLPESVHFAGYRKTVSLSMPGPFRPELRPAIWNLLQLPPGGTIVVPGNAPHSYFGRGEWKAGDGAIAAEVPSPGEPYKFGIDLAACSGRMFYTRWEAERPYFVFRSFTPPGGCCDAPYSGGVACPQQFFCDNGADGGFGELEYHSEPLPESGGSIVDRCLTGAFSGPLEALQPIYRKLFTKGWQTR